ncbi:uncharacterized protein CANTADRAFT_91034 [Suhomyces tanzawaensis NRRL Y-17324]|uniref:Uncharacterized protein n=1 Tax=Suhomyces tanzawaensis NRRL Y-17324 TaxID=984487 RepID=A0A1E4SGZ4_9ASCO|nr:uncharacterized protein CANTADRAFT_91034 [Suhomyces tanzawaensis NRRL Y-17324]ODV78740.1 hypothetical protein CANTADRAFT_91034 [Suhomyces tanzawaensis NRRL Y-17324]
MCRKSASSLQNTPISPPQQTTPGDNLDVVACTKLGDPPEEPRATDDSKCVLATTKRSHRRYNYNCGVRYRHFWVTE